MDLPLFLIPMAVGLMTQFLKRFFNTNHIARVGKYSFPRYGGMPSAHASFGFSLATIIYLVEGPGSGSFAIAIALVILLLDDALRMRMYLSQHGQAINQLLAKQQEGTKNGIKDTQERLGHTPSEVIVGAIVGVLLTHLLWYFLQYS